MTKYGNVPQTYNGYHYHSKLEANYAWELDQRLKTNDIKAWERQVKIELEAYGKHICNYYMDFVLHHHDGKKEYVEVKGFMTNVAMLKIKMFKAKLAKEEPQNIFSIIRG